MEYCHFFTHLKRKLTSIFGLPLDTLQSSYRASYSPAHLADIHDFLAHNLAFAHFRYNVDRVTSSSLRSFDLTELRKVLGYDSLENAITQTGMKILPILDEKVRVKVAAEYEKYFEVSSKARSRSRSVRLPSRSRSRARARSRARGESSENEDEDKDEGRRIERRPRFKREQSETPPPVILNQYFQDNVVSPTDTASKLSSIRRRQKTPVAWSSKATSYHGVDESEEEEMGRKSETEDDDDERVAVGVEEVQSRLQEALHLKAKWQLAKKLAELQM